MHGLIFEKIEKGRMQCYGQQASFCLQKGEFRTKSDRLNLKKNLISFIAAWTFL